MTSSRAQTVCKACKRLHAGQALSRKRSAEGGEALLRPRFRRRCPAAEAPAPPPSCLQLAVPRATWAALLSAVLAELRPGAAGDAAAAAGEDAGFAPGGPVCVSASAQVAVSLPCSGQGGMESHGLETLAPPAEQLQPQPAPAEAVVNAAAAEGPNGAPVGAAPDGPDAPVSEAGNEAAGQLTADAPAANGLAHLVCSREGSPMPAGSAMEGMNPRLSGEPGGGGPEAGGAVDAPGAPGEAPTADPDAAPAPIRASKRIRRASQGCSVATVQTRHPGLLSCRLSGMFAGQSTCSMLQRLPFCPRSMQGMGHVPSPCPSLVAAC